MRFVSLALEQNDAPESQEEKKGVENEISWLIY